MQRIMDDTVATNRPGLRWVEFPYAPSVTPVDPIEHNDGSLHVKTWPVMTVIVHENGELNTTTRCSVSVIIDGQPVDEQAIHDAIVEVVQRMQRGNSQPRYSALGPRGRRQLHPGASENEEISLTK
jgi:hypothetical protein